MSPKQLAATKAFDRAAQAVKDDPRDDEAWRELCRARATLRAYS